MRYNFSRLGKKTPDKTQAKDEKMRLGLALATLLGTGLCLFSLTGFRKPKEYNFEENLTPTEIINLRTNGKITSGQMKRKLIAYPYKKGVHDPNGAGITRGEWNQVERALSDGLITKKEYEYMYWRSPSRMSPNPYAYDDYSAKGLLAVRS